jgi:glycosyltransferase involved in cell wall biosynthesis
MSAWNTDSGASIHAELIGREWVKAGHQLSVFSFYEYSIHGTALTDKDEDYVIRCFTTSTHSQVKLDPVPFLREDYEIFVVEDLGMLPQDPLGKIFHWIKRKAKTVTVIHDGRLSDNPSFYQFDWDAIVGFDERYIKFLKEVYPAELLHQIPYPCHPLKIGDKEAARRILNLPSEKKILFMFGPAARTGVETIPWILEYGSSYSPLILIVSRDKEAIAKAREYSSIVDVEVREETLTLPQLYEYLHASDALIINKPSMPQVTISSTVFQCLGSGCPIIARSSNFIETLRNEVLKFRDRKEFGDCLIEVLEQRENYRSTVENAKKYVLENSAEIIANRFIDLFKKLK